MMRPHVLTNLGWILVTIFLLTLPILGLAMLWLGSVTIPLTGATILVIILTWSLIILGGAFQWFLHWIFNIYTLTSRRVVDIDFLGLFHRRISQCPLRNVEDVTFSKRGLLQSFFDYGDIHIQTAGTLSNFDFHAIPDPEGSLKQILDLVSEVKRGYRFDHGDNTNRPERPLA